MEKKIMADKQKPSVYQREPLDFSCLPFYNLYKDIDGWVDDKGETVAEYVKKNIIPKCQKLQKQYADIKKKGGKIAFVVVDKTFTAIATAIDATVDALKLGYKDTVKAFEITTKSLEKVVDTLHEEREKLESASKKVTTTLTSVKEKITPKRVGTTGQNAMAEVNENDKKQKDKKSDVKDYK